MKPLHLFAGLLFLPLGARAQDAPELEAARRKLKPAPGLEVTLWASEPLLQNPVAIAFDEQGRCYVAECHRRHTSTLDIHMRKEWLDDDLACRRHEDLVAYHEKRLGAKAAEWKVESERIRLLSDPGGKGRATEAVTFSDGYRGLGEGIGAGLLVRNGEVWYTCIPNLWHFKDGVRRSLHSGFGVHLGASGHDMHGLRFGPDGKIYWSHGDRGFHVEAEGKTFSFPDGGGVLRANPDGSELEIVCTGLRNPQELAFDQYGNLFTGDNNISKAPDVGETCRWTYVVEGADYGWRIGYQFMPTGGAWCAEEQWKLEAAYQVPHVARLGHGPSGVTVHPGVAAIPDRYRNHFFMCDYPGGVYAFEMKPKGASFEMVDLSKLVWDVNAPDVEFGNDGALYAADWAGMWDKVDKGRIWRLADPGKEKDAAVLEVRRLIAEGMSKRPADELAKLLAHADQRIRQNAQFELAARKDAATLSALAKAGPQLSRIHAIWGLGQLGQGLPELLKDEDAEIRAQAAKVIGNLRSPADLAPLLKDPSPRVRYFAAMGLGKIGKKDAIPAVVEFLRANNNDDRMLQHAGIMALTWIGDVPSIVALGKDPSAPVRLAALVALRKLKRPEVASFLEAHPLEAARAIYDTPIPEAMAALAELRTGPEAALLRAVNAMFRLGKAAELVAFAKGRAPLGARVEALRVLGEWTQPSGRDRLMGLWRPIPARDRKDVEDALKGSVTAFLDEPELAVEAVRLAGAPLAEIFADRKWPAAARAGALRGMVEAKDPRLGDAVAQAVDDKDEAVAREGVRHLTDAARLETIATGERPLSVRQAAVAALANDAALARLLDAGLPAALQVEWAEAASKRPALKARLEQLEPSLLEGGDAKAGRRIFVERADVQCVRCHKIAGEGGEVGPDLSRIAEKKDAAYLLESVLFPNKQIAEGWGQTALQLASDAVEVGRVEKENERELTLVLADGQRKTIAKADVKARKAALSAMPDDVAKLLSKRDVRDLVAYLTTLK